MEAVRLTVNVDIETLDTDVTITAYYVEEQDIWAFIVPIDTTVNTIPFTQGDAGIIADDTIYNFYLNNIGELIVECNNPQQFSIDNNGSLTQQI